MTHQFQAMKLPGYGEVPGMPQMPKAPALEGYITNDERIGGPTFGHTLGSLLQKANDTMAVPEDLSIKALQTGNVDIHEVMIALGKSEVSFKLITAITQKVVSAFDKLTSLQV